MKHHPQRGISGSGQGIEQPRGAKDSTATPVQSATYHVRQYTAAV